tara:strand:+ start:1229 stop:1846 length:618 start_codon:yes stop_codon:yes gene_type:complete
VWAAHTRALGEVAEEGEGEDEDEEEDEDNEGGSGPEEAEGEEAEEEQDEAAQRRAKKVRRLNGALRVLSIHLRLPPKPTSTAGNSELVLMRIALSEVEAAIPKAQAQREEASALEAAAGAEGVGPLRLEELLQSAAACLEIGARWERDAQAASDRATKADAAIAILVRDTEGPLSQDATATTLQKNKDKVRSVGNVYVVVQTVSG